MDEVSCMHPDLNNQTFRLNKVNEIKDYFIAEIRVMELISKRLSKHIAAFGYFDKTLIVLSAISGGDSIASFATAIGVPIGKASASLNFVFSITTEIVKKLLKTKINKQTKSIVKLLC